MIFIFVMSVSLIGGVVKGKCPEECVCDNEEVFCKAMEVPNYIPNNTLTVFLELDHTDSLAVTDNRTPFAGSSWAFVTKLHLKIPNGTSLYSRPFSKLRRLEFLSVRIPYLDTISRDLLYGLDNLLTLDWSDHRYLILYDMIICLYYSPLWSLQSLYLNRIQKFFVNPVDFDSNFFYTIGSMKNLKVLELSEVNINKIDYRYTGYVCSSLEYLKLESSVIAEPTNIVQPPCESLRVLDISNVRIPGISTFLDASDLVCDNFRVYSNVEILYMNNIFKDPSGLVLDKFAMTLTGCDFSMKELYAAYNDFRWLNVSVLVSNATNGLSVFDVSHNKLEYISPNIFKPSPDLQILNMSFNYLDKMQQLFPMDFVAIFKNLPKLREVHLTDNQISNISVNTFLENHKLQLLDLSGNRITRLFFRIDHMDYLKLLNLSRNLIKFIDESSRTMLNNFQANISGTVEFKLDVSYNPFHCECKSDAFISWMRSSIVISNTTDGYNCILNGKSINIFDVDRLKKSCETVEVTMYLIVGAAAVGVLVAIIVLLYVIQRKRSRRRRYMDGIEAVCRLADDEFLVFLSHCSEDRNKADKIYNRLNQELKNITQVDRDHVSYGDRDFRPGFSVHQEVTRALENTSVVVYLVSTMFCQKNWCQIELRQALQLQKHVVLVMLEHVDRDYMNPLMQDSFDRLTHASWTDGEGDGIMKPDWTSLCTSIIELTTENNNV